MKKLILITLMFTFSQIVFSQQSNLDQFISKVFVNYSENEIKNATNLLKSDKGPEILNNIISAYSTISEKVRLYGGGLNEYQFIYPIDNSTRIGICQGWTGNFFYSKQNGNYRSTEYVKIWEIGSSKIIEENGYKFILLLPKVNTKFEKRTWQNDSDTRNGEVNSIRLYIDWTLEEDLIQSLNASFNTWGTFNESIK